jgi:hypothetical protein
MTPTPKADFVPLGAGHTHDLILLEWTTKDPKAAADDASCSGSRICPIDVDDWRAGLAPADATVSSTGLVTVVEDGDLDDCERRSLEFSRGCNGVQSATATLALTATLAM